MLTRNFQQIKLSQEQFDVVSSLIEEHGHARFNIPIDYPWNINVFNEDSEFKAKHEVNIGVA